MIFRDTAYYEHPPYYIIERKKVKIFLFIIEKQYHKEMTGLGEPKAKFILK